MCGIRALPNASTGVQDSTDPLVVITLYIITSGLKKSSTLVLGNTGNQIVECLHFKPT